MRFHDLRHFNAIIMMKYGVPDMDRQGSIVIEGAFSKRIEEAMKTEQG